MKIGIICEYSATVREAFRLRGHYAVSCDLLPSEIAGLHFQGDCRNYNWSEFDLLICHPPCTHLAVSGARHFRRKAWVQIGAIAFAQFLWSLPVHRIALEQPVSILSSIIGKPTQIIQPWQFGHGETKKTCLWLKNLPPLVPTDIVEGREARVHKMPPGPNRWKERSRTYQGIANAMAEQWGSL